MVLLRQELLEQLETTEEMLQHAVMLEHATIPPYLYALYSLDPKKNGEIAELILSVVQEEMAHMALAANILNAIGGAPSIDDPAFIPTYPGPLPGGVEEDLRVPLKPFSQDLMRKVFMKIEEPEFKPVALIAESDELTIGAFYKKIAEKIEAEDTQLEREGKTLFTGDPKRQVCARTCKKVPMGEIVCIENRKDALAAIETIVEQGEGTEKDPEPDDELAHYYRFKEIAEGRKLVKVDGSWGFKGDPIPFDPSGVLPAMKNPAPKDFKPGSAVRYAFDAFNYTYTSLLKALHETFNGTPETLSSAVGLMESLKEQALTLMTTVVRPGSKETAGPGFRYQPTNP